MDLQGAVAAEHFETQSTAVLEDGRRVFDAGLGSTVRLSHHGHVRRLTYAQSLDIVTYTWHLLKTTMPNLQL